jgi:predicted AlkP superfamily pyrophosphatase or phosphodiesterase
MLRGNLNPIFNRRNLLLIGALVAASPALAATGTSPPKPAKPLVLLISIDGMRPDAVLDAARHGLKVPNLRAFVADGAYATGVRGVLPTLTYPSHMTLMTGTSPAKHGIYANTTFDPFGRNEHGWYWYAEDARVATLWTAAAAAHLRTANVYWPTSVGAPITFNLPQIWRTGTDDDLKLQRALSTPGLERELSSALGRYPGGMDENVTDDELRARFAQRLLETKRPDFITVYLTGLDTEEHKSGPFSASSNDVLERLDALVGTLRTAAEHIAPRRTTVCVVSDHGFVAVEHDVNLYAAFRAAGLMTVDEANKVSSWKAMPWLAGGSAAVLLADPGDGAVQAEVAALLDRLAHDPGNGIERILAHDEIVRDGGFPDAAFLVSFKNGYEVGSAMSGPLVSGPSNLGMHGYVPDRLELRSSFFIVGPHVAAGRSLGEIDMRRIAPTLAGIMGFSLRDADLSRLSLE